MLFISDIQNNKNLSYDQLLDYINSDIPIYSNFKTDNVFDYICNLIKAICNNIDILILDFDFTKDEVEKFIGKSYVEERVEKLFFNAKTVEDLVHQIKISKSIITIFTSGTTGQPKQVAHTVENLIREVRIGEKYKSQVWALAYNITHIAGLQVLFQGALNINPLYYVYKLEKEVILDSLDKFNITNISATPTFYRLLLPTKNIYGRVKNISIGGEKSSYKLIEFIKYSFPNARINNIYASTEAGTLLATNGVNFTIPIQKKYLVKIEDLEILVHRKMLGYSNSFEETEWYKTGDLIEWVDEENGVFKIVSRKNELLNIGGHKINPGEIELVLEQFDGVDSAFVYGKPNSVLGTILCCDIQSKKEISVEQLKLFLKNILQPFKIPRLFYFKSELDLTRNGKLKRQ